MFVELETHLIGLNGDADWLLDNGTLKRFNASLLHIGE